MKQRDLLFAGLLLFAAPAFAQDGPTFDPAKDAKVVFTQDFEADWKTWTTTAVDTIFKVEYYDHEGDHNGTDMKPWEDGWKRGLWRDSTIILYNGVVVCDEDEDWFETPEKNATIVRDGKAEAIQRHAEMAMYGEADNGGDYYFKFMTDSAPTRMGSSSYSNGLSARYRRNLFVRGLDIEDNSSYRLTFYVKGKVRKTKPEDIDVNPTLYADVMRGYFHAEKPFSMGYINDNKNYKYTNAFEYTKDFFNGDWEKVTFMTYYQNDTVANNYVFVNGYWWADGGAWTWPSKDSVGSTNPKKYDLNYHVQPDKFFVRLGFASNYTEFSIDNISLTKSFIGGVEYYEDMLRVNFGYQTNLKDLAREAYAKTRIDAVEVPGKYFEVWGLKIEDGDSIWEPTDIATAEYQGDGYMYMFTDVYKDPTTGELKHYTFDDYEKVLVSFINPTEKELQLKYTGSTFPKANDIEWIKAGKLVPNFYNEVAQLNPNVFVGVYSMNNRPPVMQKGITAEDGTFGLKGNIREFKFQFSHKMEIDNPSNADLRKKCIVYVGKEVWDRTWTPLDATNDPEGAGILTLSRPAKYTEDLTGDVVIEMNNLYMPNTDRKGEDVAIHYNFGTINRDLSAAEFAAPIWNAKFYDKTVNTGASQLMPAGTAAIYESGNSWWGYTKNVEVGDGKTKRNAAQLFFYQDEYKYPRALFLCPMGQSENHPALLYLGYGDGFEINLANGSYVVKFDAGAFYKNATIGVRVMPYNEDPRNVDKEDIIEVGSYAFTKNFGKGIHDNATSDLDTLMTPMQFGFAIEKSGRYLIEISCKSPSSGSNPGVMLSDIELYNAPVCYNPIKGLNDAIEAAQARVALAADAKYAGSALETLNALIAKYKDGGTWTPTGVPSDWNSASQATKDATQALKLRMDTVDLVVNKIKDVAKKLEDVAKDSADWKNLPEYKTLESTKATADAYNYSAKANAELTAFIKTMDDQIKNLDARVKDTKQFGIEIAKAKALVDAKEDGTLPEYGTLKEVYEEYEDFNAITATYANLTAAIDAVFEAAHAYNLAVGLGKIAKRRVIELDALATKVGSHIKDSAVVAERFAALKGDDDYLAEIYKAAIKAAIYANPSAIAAGEDVSAFIKNYYFYATPIVAEEMDVQMPETRANLKYSEERHGKANVGHTKHQYQSGKPIWTVLTQTPFTDLLPGWTITAGNGSGNDMLFLGDMNANNDSLYQNAVFDARLTMDWGGEADLTQYVYNLPAGEYELGLDVHMSYNSGNDAKSPGNGKLEVRPGGRDVKMASASVKTGWILPDSVMQGDTLKVANTAKCDTTVFYSVKFNVADTETEATKVHAYFATGNGSGWFGDFKLTFKPQASYADSIVAAANAEIAKVITVVDFTRAQVDNVEYYTLGGLKVDGVKPGQILIRKTTGANGKVKVDKVLLK